MRKQPTIIKKADFNPRIKSYYFYTGLFILLFTIVGIPLIIFWVLGLGQKFCRKKYESLECTLTTRHLQFKKGVLVKVEKTIPLDNIQDLTFVEGPLLKFFNLCILKIETAGQSNPRSSDMSLIGIMDAQDFRNLVMDQRDELTERTETPMIGKGTENNTALLQEIRDLLKVLVEKQGMDKG